MDKALKTAIVGPPQVGGWGGVSGNHQGRVNSVSQVNENSDMVSACKLCGEGLRKGTGASASTSVWVKAAPPASFLKRGKEVPPHMSLVPFKLLLQCWSSERVS